MKNVADYTEIAKAEFKRWEKEGYPIFNAHKEQLKVDEDEFFFPAFDYLHKDSNGDLDPVRDYRYYVSNKGTVISFNFRNLSEPRWMSLGLGASESGKYQTVTLAGKTTRVHKLVWFSYMAWVIKNKQEHAYYYGVIINDIADLKILAGQPNKYMMHHINGNESDNRIDNLELLPSVVHLVFEFLNRQGKKDKIEIIRKYLKDNTVCIISPEQTVDVKKISRCYHIGDINSIDWSRTKSNGEYKKLSMLLCAIQAEEYAVSHFKQWQKYDKGEEKVILICDENAELWFYVCFIEHVNSGDKEERILRIQNRTLDDMVERSVDLFIKDQRLAAL